MAPYEFDSTSLMPFNRSTAPNGNDAPGVPIEISNRDIDEEKLRRLIIESIDVAFLLCNKFYHFRAGKIMDIINQVLPTAYVYDTSYWPFYNYKNQSLCACESLMVRCEHAYVDGAYVDLHKYTGTEGIEFEGSCEEAVTVPRNISIDIDFDGFLNEVEIYIQLSIMRINFDYVHFLSRTKFNMLYEIKPFYKRRETVILKPHPRKLPYYGRYQRYDVGDTVPPIMVRIDGLDTPYFSIVPKEGWFADYDVETKAYSF